MTTLIRAAALCALTGVFMLTGCTKPPGAASPDPLSADKYPRIAALEGLDRNLSFATPIIDDSPGGPLSVTVPLRWRSDKEINVQYRFIFFDAAGSPAGPDPAWQQTYLPARSQEFVTGAALAKEATDWRLEVRPSRGEQ